MKSYLLVDTGTYFLKVICIISKDEIEITNDTLEFIASQLIKRDVHFNYYVVGDVSDDIDEHEGFMYLDLSCYGVSYNIYMDISNLRFRKDIPKEWDIDEYIRM